MFGCLPHGAIDVGAECQRHPPIGHRRLRILLDCRLKRPDRLFMVEGIHKSQPLIEIPLGLFRCGSDGVVEGAEIIEERRSIGLIGRRSVRR